MPLSVGFVAPFCDTPPTITVDYLIYFAGPLVLALMGAKLLSQPYRVFGIGVLGFLVAWVIMQTAVTVASGVLHLAPASFGHAVLVAALAGLVEESTRYIVFSRFAAFRANRNAQSSFMYAIGHHGLETVIVGLSLALMILAVRYKPDAISDPVTLKQCQEAAALGFGARVYNAVERVSVGLLIHVCFSGVVMLAVARRQRAWLFVAMTWHFAHDLVGLNLHRLSSHWLVGKLWILVVVVVYSFIATRIYRALRAAEPPTPPAPSPSSAILPGRSG